MTDDRIKDCYICENGGEFQNDIVLPDWRRLNPEYEDNPEGSYKYKLVTFSIEAMGYVDVSTAGEQDELPEGTVVSSECNQCHKAKEEHRFAGLCSMQQRKNLTEVRLWGNAQLTEKGLAKFLSSPPPRLHSPTLDNCGLVEPPDLPALVNLTKLRCCNNEGLTELPDLPTLLNLKEVNCYGCHITKLPPSLFGLKSLSKLGVANNPFADSQKGVQKICSTFTQLTELDIQHMEVTKLPDMSALVNLKELICGWCIHTTEPTTETTTGTTTKPTTEPYRPSDKHSESFHPGTDPGL